jgi:hypothetical protein
MEATFKIKMQATEMSMEVYEKIKMFINLHGESDVIINIRPKKKRTFPMENKEAYFARLDKSLASLNGKKEIVTFSVDEFNSFVDSKL